MSVFFFDVDDRKRKVRDFIGIELIDEAHAIHEASVILDYLVTIARTERRPGIIAISIRTESSACLYEASISLVRE